MNRAERFLDLYKNLEELLNARYAGRKPNRYPNPVMNFLNDPDGRGFKEELNLCREIRNLLSHHSKFDGDPAVEPAESLISFLERLIRYLENPPTALTIATPVENLLRVTRDEPLLSVLSRMEERGFSHVPVMQNKTLYGVLSVSTLFSYFRSHPDEMLGHDATVGKLWEELPVSRHVAERFEFVPADCGYDKLRDKYNAGGPKRKRLAAVFVTKDGSFDSTLLGMITPWDMLRTEPDV